MNETLKLIEERRSIKGYTDKMPEKKDIDLVIKAGLEAASGRNKQGAIILAVTDKDIRDKLSAANAALLGAQSDPFYGAPAVLVVLGDKSVSTHVYDGSLVMGNMMLAAHAIGLGSCWIHRAREVFELDEWKEFLRSRGIEGEYEGIGNLVIGYPSGDYPAEKPRNPGRVFYI